MEDFVTFEIAKKLKEKGYPQGPEDFDWRHYDDWENHAEYYHFDERRSTLYQINNCKLKMWYDPTINRDELYLAPTISQVLKWLREKDYIHLEITIGEKGWKSQLVHYRWQDEIGGVEIGSCCDTYEEAALEGIEYILDTFI